MTAAAQSSPKFELSLEWLRHLLAKELAPYPGRLATVSRIVIAATFTALLIMTFKLPGASLGPFLVLILPRDSLRATAASGFSTFACYVLAAVYLLIGVMSW